MMASKWKEFWASPLGNGIKAILRNVLITAAGLLITSLITLFTGAEIDPTVKLLVVGALKVIDELLHKTGIAEKGLTRF
jgi:hypothetical protein